MAKINQSYTVLNLAIKQAWGREDLQVTDASSLVALHDYVVNSADASQKDAFTGAITDIIGKTLFIDNEYTPDDLGISHNEMEYGAILRKIRVKPKTLQYNEEYDLAADDTIDPFSIEVPVVNEQLYSNFSTFKEKVTITDAQLFTGLESDAEVSNFYSLIFKQLADGILRGKVAHERTALNNFIAEKFVAQAKQPTKMHTFNILRAYNKDNNKNLKFNGGKCHLDEDYNKYFASKIMELKGYMAEDTDVFNASDGFNSQTPADRLNVYMLKGVDAKLGAYLYGPMYHDEFVKISGYKTVNYWQAINASGAKPFDFETCSSIAVKVASDATGNTVVEQRGIVCVMMSNEAVATSYNRELSEAVRIPLKGTNHFRAVTRMMLNDLWENALIIYEEDEEDVVDSLEFTAGTLTPTFASDTYTYTLATTSGTATTTLTVDAEPISNVAVAVNGESVKAEDDGTFDLAIADEDVITVAVTKADYTVTYTITVAES